MAAGERSGRWYFLALEFLEELCKVFFQQLQLVNPLVYFLYLPGQEVAGMVLDRLAEALLGWSQEQPDFFQRKSESFRSNNKSELACILFRVDSIAIRRPR